MGGMMEPKVAFITGASRGIGKASAIALAEAGYDVVVTARTVREGEKYNYGPTAASAESIAMPGSISLTAEEVRKRGREALAIRLDLLDHASIDAAIEQTLRQWGHIDVLVNNGIYQGPGVADQFLDVTEEMVKKVFEGNVFAQIYITQKILPGMLQRGRGVVINVTSPVGVRDPGAPSGQGGWGLGYGASKAAFYRIAGILRAELGQRGIRAYNVNPPLVLTEAHKVLYGGETFGTRFGDAPATVPAAAIVWLATAPEAEAMNGQTINSWEICAERRLVAGWPK
jgi:NAD(P)-dependent dehydrogenase (short-subunit alcohol dehydrogenase family)